jgi:Lipase (class 3)
MGNTESSSPRTPSASEEEEEEAEECDDDDEYHNHPQSEHQEKYSAKDEETASLLLLSPSWASNTSSASAAAASSPDKTKKKKRHTAAAEAAMINLHRQARDLSNMCFWVSSFLKRFNENNSSNDNNGKTNLSEDGYTPEETLHMLLFAAQQQQLLQQQQQQSSITNSHPPQTAGDQLTDEQHVVEESEMSALQELNAQCVEYMTAHSQPGAPRIINATSRLRRRQRLIERPMTLLLSQNSASSSNSTSSLANDAFASSNYGAVIVNRDTNNTQQQQQRQDEQLFYGIVKDDVNQRIVLVFHETPAMQSSSGSTSYSSSSWLDWLHLRQVHVPLPTTLRGKVPRNPNIKNGSAPSDFVDSIGLRADLYHFLFSDEQQNDNSTTGTKTTTTAASRYQALLSSLQHVLRAHPSYTFHVTGVYGCAAACAVMAAFFLAAEPQANLYNHVLFNTNPIVNCLTFACPRVGDGRFLQACQYLEKGQGEEPNQARHISDNDDDGCRSPLLQMGRVVVNSNDNDVSAQIPMWNYSHVGFQIRLNLSDKQDASPDSSSNTNTATSEITYPKLVDHWQNRWRRTRRNAISIPSFCKLLLYQSQQQDSSFTRKATVAAANYRMAIQQAQGHLQEYKEGLTSLYIDSNRREGTDHGNNNWTGF